MEPNQSQLWKKLSLLLIAVFAIVGAATFRDYGMSWDQTTRWESGDLKIEYYSALAKADDKLDFIKGYYTDNYPGLYDMSLSLVSRALPFDRLSIDQFMSFSFSVLLLTSVILVTKRFGGWKLAFFSGLFLLCMPRVYGHAFINPKDIPFAATYWLALLALFATALDEKSAPSWRQTILCGLAIGACLATRIAGLVLFGYLAILIGRSLVLNLKASSSLKPFLLAWAARLPAIVILAYAVLIPFWPGIHKSPFGASAAILDKLHGVSSSIPLLYQGNVYAAGTTPWSYILGMTLVTTPIVLLVLVLVFLITSLKKLSTEPRTVETFLSPGITFAAILAFPVAYILYSQPSIHNGSRHFIFVLPSIAIAAAASFIWIQNRIAERYPKFRIIPPIAAGLFVLFQIAWMASYHPYQYIFFNQLASGPSQARFNYEFEYWFTANHEAFQQLVEKLEATNDPRLTSGRPIQLLVAGPVATVRNYADSRFAFTTDPQQADFFIAGTTLQTDTLIDGETYLVIERNGDPLTVVKQLRPPQT